MSAFSTNTGYQTTKDIFNSPTLVGGINEEITSKGPTEILETNESQAETTASIENFSINNETGDSFFKPKVTRSSRVYQKRLVVDSFEKILPLLQKVKSIESGSVKTVVFLVQIQKILNENWENIENDNDDLALTITALDKLISGENWKKLNTGNIETLEKILKGYIDCSDCSISSKIYELINNIGISLLPQLPEE